MGRPRKSMAEHEASGAVAKNPQRFRDRGDDLRPEVGVGDPPEEFLNDKSMESRHKLTYWNDLVNGCPPGVLTMMDRPYLISLARLGAITMRSSATGRDHKRFIDALKEAPFTPKARAGFAIRRQKAADQANHNPYSEFAQQPLPPRVN